MNCKNIKVGTGKAVINIMDNMFPIDNFNGIHDELHARMIYLNGSISVVIVSLELTSIREYEITKLKQIVNNILNVPEENIWICVSHTFSAPHTRSENALKDKEVAKKNSMFCGAIEEAVIKASEQAKKNLCDAYIGTGTGKCFINVNRDMLTPEGWWLGSNEEGFADKTVTVIKFEDINGNLKAVLYGYDVQSSIMDGVTMEDGYKLVSSDLTGAASSYIEKEFNDSLTAIYCLGAAGDVAPLLKAKYSEISSLGKIRSVDMKKDGFVLTEALGRKLGNKVISICNHIKCNNVDGRIEINKKIIRCPGQMISKDIKEIHPVHEYKYIKDEERKTPLEVLTFGNIAVLGVKPEISSITAAEIREKSPFNTTLILTMVNGGAKYMMDKESYSRITYGAMNSCFAEGSAEILRDNLLKMLNEIKEREEI